MEKENTEKFLPIGSVVLLKGGTKKAMVTGFCSVAAEDKTKIYDYTGCVYPEGYLDFEQICLFDHDQIEEVFHVGYKDVEEKAFKDELKEITSRIESGEDSISNYIEDGDFEDTDEEVEEETEDEPTPLIIPQVEEIPIEDDNTNNITEELEYL